MELPPELSLAMARYRYVKRERAGIIGNILAIVVSSVALIVGLVVVARTGSSIVFQSAALKNANNTGLTTANNTFTSVFNGILNAFTLAPTIIIALIAAVIIGALITIAAVR